MNPLGWDHMRQQYGGYSNERYSMRVISKKRLLDREEQRVRNQPQNSLLQLTLDAWYIKKPFRGYSHQVVHKTD